ncbi:hypothetical protein HaLaN_28294 [Haematococcus lacustris]|uniref:Uncharacterized protein n=1 Tax=Haematococcus lacustris TaxID=44745 RepID=A0A6A0AA66_HAELA|nr:hypothetical protein HaLaN_28294 [Haematococcus lacustris]
MAPNRGCASCSNALRVQHTTHAAHPFLPTGSAPSPLTSRTGQNGAPARSTTPGGAPHRQASRLEHRQATPGGQGPIERCAIKAAAGGCVRMVGCPAGQAEGHRFLSISWVNA